MSLAQLQRVTADFRRQLLAGDRQAATTIQDYYLAAWSRIRMELDALTAKMQAAEDAGQPVKVAWLYQEGRLQRLQAIIHSQIAGFAHNAAGIVNTQQRAAIRSGVEAARAMLGATVPRGVSWSWHYIPPAAIEHSVGALSNGSPLHRLFQTFGPEAASEASKALVTGVAMGKGPREIARDVRDTLQVPLQRALVIARTETLRSWRSAQLANYQANSDVVESWRWVCQHSVNSCAVCLAMDGSIHDLGETLDSHPQCACSMQPVTKSWADILGKLGIDASGVDESSASAGDYETGQEWFDGLSDSQQDQILGKAKGAAYRAGDIGSLSDLVARGHDSEWGGYRYERSMKDLGLDPSDYQ